MAATTRTYDSYTTEDGTTYVATYKGKNKETGRAGSYQIRKINPDGTGEILASALGGSASANKSRVGRTFDALKDGLTAAESGEGGEEEEAEEDEEKEEEEEEDDEEEADDEEHYADDADVDDDDCHHSRHRQPRSQPLQRSNLPLTATTC